MIDLLARRPTVTPEELLASFVPGARFQTARFETYRPNPGYPSQAQAVEAARSFAAALSAPAPRRLFRRAPREGRGLYLDGGFGVGKTHLLAASFFAAPGPKAFMSFQELLYAVGALGMARATAAFAPYRLLAIDEFELDDPGNTHLVNTFLGSLMPGGVSVVTTSNTEPGALGQGRFNADDFARQLQAIAARFEALRVDGPDYRQRGGSVSAPFTPAELTAWQAAQPQATLAAVTHRDLNRHLLEVHPARFGKLLAGVEALAVADLAPMPDQNVALRFVHFVDKAYDLGLRAAFSGAPLGSLFPDTYRHGAYAKKYARCLSRLGELLDEARGAVLS